MQKNTKTNEIGDYTKGKNEGIKDLKEGWITRGQDRESIVTHLKLCDDYSEDYIKGYTSVVC